MFSAQLKLTRVSSMDFYSAKVSKQNFSYLISCLLYTSPSPRDYPQPADLFNEATVLIPADSVKPLLYLLADKNTLRLFDAAGNLHAVLSKSLTKDADLYWQAKLLISNFKKIKAFGS